MNQEGPQDGTEHRDKSSYHRQVIVCNVVVEHWGPDHKFAMNPASWVDMVDRTRELERAMGSADKFVAGNEVDTVIVQRRCLRASRDIKAGEILTREMIDVLRPATPGAILPPHIPEVVGSRAVTDLPKGKELRWTDLGA